MPDRVSSNRGAFRVPLCQNKLQYQAVMVALVRVIGGVFVISWAALSVQTTSVTCSSLRFNYYLVTDLD
jgi:hypothetical protein